MSRYPLPHEELLCLMAAHDRGPDAWLAAVEELVAAHRDDAVVQADLAGEAVVTEAAAHGWRSGVGGELASRARRLAHRQGPPRASGLGHAISAPRQRGLRIHPAHALGGVVTARDRLRWLLLGGAVAGSWGAIGFFFTVAVTR